MCRLRYYYADEDVQSVANTVLSDRYTAHGNGGSGDHQSAMAGHGHGEQHHGGRMGMGCVRAQRQQAPARLHARTLARPHARITREGSRRRLRR